MEWPLPNEPSHVEIRGNKGNLSYSVEMSVVRTVRVQDGPVPSPTVSPSAGFHWGSPGHYRLLIPRVDDSPGSPPAPLLISPLKLLAHFSTVGYECSW